MLEQSRKHAGQEHVQPKFGCFHQILGRVRGKTGNGTQTIMPSERPHMVTCADTSIVAINDLTDCLRHRAPTPELAAMKKETV
jgi:hypothetical protein